MRRNSRSVYRRRRKRFNFRQISTVLTVAVFLALVFVSVNFFMLYNALRGSDSPAIWHPQDQERTHFLMVGSQGDVVTSCAVLSIPADSDRPLYLLNIPPETLLDGEGGLRESLAVIYSQQGVEPVIGALDNLLGSLSIDYSFTYDMNGLPQLLESMRPLKIEVNQGFSVTFEETDYVFAPGTNTITASNVLAFAYSEEESLSPETIFIHNRLLVAVFNELFTVNNLTNVVDNLKTANAMYETNLSTRDLARFRDTLASINSDNTNVLLLPGRWLSAEGGRYWSSEPRLVNLVVRQFLEDLPAYSPSALVIDIYNGNGVAGFAGSSAENLRTLNYQIGRVDNAAMTQQTQIYYQPEFHLAALELALLLDCEPAFIEGSFNDSDNPVSIILGKDLIGGS